MYDNLIIDAFENYAKHPSYLPSIGNQYGKVGKKTFIIGESHYLPEKYNHLITPEDWYNKPDKVYRILAEDAKSWIDTRGVIEYFTSPNKLARGHRIFQNLHNAYSDCFPERRLFENAVYFNYFQRPAEKQGGSIQIHPLDSETALQNLIELNTILSPDLIVFTSTKAFKNFNHTADNKVKQTLPKIESVPHPACAWWNRTSKNYGLNPDGTLSTGRQKFQRIIQRN
jgi:hypothetical protein